MTPNTPRPVRMDAPRPLPADADVTQHARALFQADPNRPTTHWDNLTHKAQQHYMARARKGERP